MPIDLGPQLKTSHDDWMSILIVLVGILLFAIILFVAATAGYARGQLTGYDSVMWSWGTGWIGDGGDR